MAQTVRDAWTALSRDKSAEVRAAAAGALGQLRDVQFACEAMNKILFDKSEKWLVRDAAVRAVGEQCAQTGAGFDAI